MTTQTTEQKFRVMMEDLGKPTLRGIRRCPKCGTLNGTRGISCKNKKCDVVFKERERKKGHSADSVKIITGSTVQVYSVRLRDRGPDYRGFVQLPLVQDMEGNAPEHVDPVVLETAAKCYVETCAKFSVKSINNQQSCQHVKAAVNCVEEAIPLTLKNSVLNSLFVPPETKQDIWLLATETSGPLVQRVTKNIMVVKCKANNKHPLGFLHFAFFETSRNRSQPERKFQCSCRVFKLGKVGPTKDDGPKRCVHFYACICAFASDEQLAEEFGYYINLDEFSCTDPMSMMVTIDTGLSQDLATITADVVTTETEQIPVEEQIVQMDSINLKSDDANTEVIVSEDILALQDGAKRLKTDVSLLMDSETLVQTSDALVKLTEAAETTTASHQTISVAAPIQPAQKKVSTPKSTPAKSVSTPKKSSVEESKVDLSFQQWLASVTERINQTMHYQFDGNPDPLVFHSPQKFFDCIQQRISAGCKKKRLPNFTTGFIRRDAMPLGSFTKYSWYITSIFQVKHIFDTPEMPLEITRSFVENRDGSYDLYEQPKHLSDNSNSVGGKTPIRPFELKTFLRVGVTSPEQKDPTPFVIEWIPDILPKSHIGELRIKFEYGHQRNGQMEFRAGSGAGTSEMEMIQIQPAM